MTRGFFGIGIENGKFESNLGTLFRSAQAFEAVTGSIIMYDRSMK